MLTIQESLYHTHHGNEACIEWIDRSYQNGMSIEDLVIKTKN